MKQIGEQWLENGRMYKAINSGDGCSGCVHDSHGSCMCIGGCIVDRGEFLIIKDLGPVNEEGCLAEERSGKFPEIEHQSYGPVRWSCLVMDDFGYVRTFGDTKQEAIDAWNRRHA